MANNIVAAILASGLVAALAAITLVLKKIDQDSHLSVGGFIFIGAIVAAIPTVLIKVGVVEQTSATVLIAILYFLVLLIGSALISSKAYKRAHNHELR